MKLEDKYGEEDLYRKRFLHPSLNKIQPPALSQISKSNNEEIICNAVNTPQIQNNLNPTNVTLQNNYNDNNIIDNNGNKNNNDNKNNKTHNIPRNERPIKPMPIQQRLKYLDPTYESPPKEELNQQNKNNNMDIEQQQQPQQQISQNNINKIISPKAKRPKIARKTINKNNCEISQQNTNDNKNNNTTNNENENENVKFTEKELSIDEKDGFFKKRSKIARTPPKGTTNNEIQSQRQKNQPRVECDLGLAKNCRTHARQ